MNRKLERGIVGAFIAAGVVWALTTVDLHAFEFKLDYLISLSSLLTVASFSVKEMLPLRSLAVASQLIAVPYFLLQPTPLWTPAGWTLLFTVINLYYIARILLERRPVQLSADEQRLYDLAFDRLQPKEFLRLAKLGAWSKGTRGEHIFEQGKVIEHILIPISGAVSASRAGKRLVQLNPGELIGAGVALGNAASLYSAEFAEDSRYISWQVADIRRYKEKNPDVRDRLNDMINHHLVTQVDKLALDLAGSSGPEG
jgi:CRP-like cAMP-binding protein